MDANDLILDALTPSVGFGDIKSDIANYLKFINIPYSLFSETEIFVATWAIMFCCFHFSAR